MQAKSGLPTKVITIHVAGGEITVSPLSAKLKSGQKVRWQSPNGPAKMVFSGMSPLTKATVETAPSDGGHSTAEEPLKSGVDPGVYHYAVGVIAEGTLALVAGCPEIIVDL